MRWGSRTVDHPGGQPVPGYKAQLRFRDVLDELRLSKEETWFATIGFFASVACALGLTKAETLERVGKAYDLYAKEYESHRS